MVHLGFFSFTEITHPGEHRAYNEWHQLDHLPEQYPLPGVAWGQRWVLSPACRRAALAVEPPMDGVHYVTCYLMDGPTEATLRGFRELGRQLREAGRFHLHRRAVLSGPFDVTAADAAPRVLVSAAAVPFRPNLGAYVALFAGPPKDAPNVGAAALGRALVETPGVAGVWQFRANRAGTTMGWDADHHVAALCYLDAAPLEVAPALNAVFDRHGRELGSALLLATPLETITPWQWGWFDDEGSDATP